MSTLVGFDKVISNIPNKRSYVKNMLHKMIVSHVTSILEDCTGILFDDIMFKKEVEGGYWYQIGVSAVVSSASDVNGFTNNVRSIGTLEWVTEDKDNDGFSINVKYNPEGKNEYDGEAVETVKPYQED